jgi:hypothetical protein
MNGDFAKDLEGSGPGLSRCSPDVSVGGLGYAIRIVDVGAKIRTEPRSPERYARTSLVRVMLTRGEPCSHGEANKHNPKPGIANAPKLLFQFMGDTSLMVICGH